MNTETQTTPIGPLQEQLNSKADAQLSAELNKLFGPIEQRCHGVRFLPSDYKGVLIGHTPCINGECGLSALLTGVRRIIEDELTDRNRQNYTAEFLKKVETLQSQIDELAGQIQQ